MRLDFKNIKARDKAEVTAKGEYNKGTWKVMMKRPPQDR